MRRHGAAKRRSLLIALFGCAMLTTTAHGDGVGNIMTSKSLPPATVAVIDPEGGSGGGTGTSDVNVGAGDIIYFRLNSFAVPDKAIRGLNTYITEYLPPNTRLVGVRILDENGLARPPNPPGVAEDTCASGRCNNFNNLPTSSGTASFDNGSIAQLYADTGVFYTTDSRLERVPGNTFLTLTNGIVMSPEPTRIGDISTLLGATSPFRAHNAWDWIQVQAFGIGNASVSGNQGTGTTPFLYGSPVAGPDTHFTFEATEVGGNIVFDDNVGPWQRIQYPGSTIGTGCAPDAAGCTPLTGNTRATLDASTLGTDVTPLNPVDATAVRFAAGEARVGQPLSVEVALLVDDTPLDPVQMDDVDCAEVFGGDTSGQSGGNKANDNPWMLYLPSPSCVFLKLKFDLEVDKALAEGGDLLTYTLDGHNLSFNDQNNVVIEQEFDSSRQSFVSASDGGVLLPASSCRNALPCVQWNLGTVASGETFTFTTTFMVGGIGGVTNVQTATFTSTDIPAFETTAINLVRPTGVADVSLAPSWDPTADFAVAGSGTTGGGTTARLQGSIDNVGTSTLATGDFVLVIPSGWTAGTMTYNCGAGSLTETCTGCSSGQATYNLSETIPLGGSCSYSIPITVAGGTSAGLYDAGVKLWVTDSGTYETFYRGLTKVNVGQRRTVAPVLDCPLLSTVSSVTGSVADTGSGIGTVYFDGYDRGDGTYAAGGIDIPSSAWTGTFGAIYGGLEVRATATATGELESELSDACYVTQVPTCSNGLDDDGDGFIDFPADPGCSSARDRSEVDVQCSDGIDNDGDGDVDFPDDLECSSPNDTTEGGSPACGDGEDNDGDGLVDTADPDCTSSTDRTEWSNGVCDDYADNDGDGLVDFGSDPGCDSVVDPDETDPSPTPGDIRARLLVVFDSSGSMNWNTCTDTFTDGDGSVECAGSDVSCATCNATGCGDGVANDSRLDKAKAGLSSVVEAFGEVEFGLMRFHQRAMSFSCPTANASAQSGGWQGAGAAPCSGGFNAADLLVGFSQENQSDLLAWMDGENDNDAIDASDTPAGGDIEIRGTGTTPLAGSLASAETYLINEEMNDTFAACRPYRVILVTDGVETCGGDPTSAAASLLAEGYQVNVIGFAVSDAGARASLDGIASAGGTGSAIFVSDEATLAAAISDIVDDTLLVETCDNADNDCDSLVDEGFAKFCDRPNGITALTQCADPGETVCDGEDDNCNGFVDEGLLNACGECGPTPMETCNGIDDDCDGAADEGVCSGCVPQPERCNNVDDDCDTAVDEGLTRGCGTDVGVCTAGVETCTAGMWGGCSATGGGGTETCDGTDEDCDGVVDEGVTMACGISTGVCEPGVYLCVGGSFDTSTCVGAVGTSAELCNTLDDDCDGTVDEGTDPGTTCGSSTGACTPGTLRCIGGSLVCDGGTGGVAEVCDAMDNDCDGNVDEEVPTGGACGNGEGECNPGVLTCQSGAFVCVGETGGRAEVCDGIDNDCDMNIDEGDPGGGASCGSSEGVCTPGTTACVGGTLECTGAGTGGPEECNVLDDDCDGLVDEGNPEGGADCGATDVGTCELGSEVCQGGSLVCVGERGPGTEICDGLDNDCDTLVDEGNPEGGDACGDDTGACMAGTTLCTGGMLVCDGAVGPTEEICNGIDDDCDGVIDDGLDVGAPCGSAIGECQPGIQLCEDGAIVCDGAIGPEAETCDALDNDCDMAVDEELPAGGVCGETEGVCAPGMIQCVDGAEVCVGEMPAGPEVCDCEDNDCDMMTDEGSLCGDAGGQCVDCQCALPCSTGEFGRCPTGRTEVEIDGMCFCVAPRCTEETCGMETLDVGGETVCAPDEDGVPSCVCKSNECTFPCDGVVCSDGSVCNPDTGRCVVDDCRGIGCPDGEICEISSLSCVPDPCGDDVVCGADEACRDGECEPSCATVECADGEICTRGSCVVDQCDGVSCPSDERCDPDTGECVEDLCIDRMCLEPSVCDPEDGGCAEDPCLRVRCPGDERCFEGECIPPPTSPDGGMSDVDAGTGEEPDLGPSGEEDPEERILATGGGGCTCRVQPSDGPPGWPSGLMLALVTLGLIRRRRNR